jgi:cytochrome c biogenesis protein CcdA
MDELIGQYYVWLSSLAGWLTLPFSNLADSLNIPVVSALLFGLIGAAAPCQLSSSVATLAFLSRNITDSRRVWAQTLAFVAGKVTVYLLVGGTIVLLGLQLDQLSRTAIPIVVIARRALGPLLIGVGLFMVGLFQGRLSFGGRVSTWLQAKVGEQLRSSPGLLVGCGFFLYLLSNAILAVLWADHPPGHRLKGWLALAGRFRCWHGAAGAGAGWAARLWRCQYGPVYEAIQGSRHLDAACGWGCVHPHRPQRDLAILVYLMNDTSQTRLKP